MSSSLATPRAQREVKPVEPRLSGLIGAVRNTHATLKDFEGGEWFLSCVERAMEAVGPKKDAALTMQIDGGQLKNQLNGVGHLSARRMGLLPQEFWEALIEELRAHFGMDNKQERLDRALDGMTRCLHQIAQLTREK